MKLSELPRRTVATVASVDDQVANDPISRRLRELGFVPGEQVEVMAVGPIAAEPMLVQVGFTRFALRRREAARVSVRLGAAQRADAVSDVGQATAEGAAVTLPESAEAVRQTGPADPSGTAALTSVATGAPQSAAPGRASA